MGRIISLVSDTAHCYREDLSSDIVTIILDVSFVFLTLHFQTFPDHSQQLFHYGTGMYNYIMCLANVLFLFLSYILFFILHNVIELLKFSVSCLHLG